jgi:hypothetical protein
MCGAVKDTRGSVGHQIQKREREREHNTQSSTHRLRRHQERERKEERGAYNAHRIENLAQ